MQVLDFTILTHQFSFVYEIETITHQLDYT